MPKPPPTTDQILDDIRRSNAAILVATNQSLDVQSEQLKVAQKDLDVQNEQLKVAKSDSELQKEQLVVAQETLQATKHIRRIEFKQLEILTAQSVVLAAILKTLENIFKVINTHVYTLTIKKEKPPMAVQPGIASAFQVFMQDNGNTITPPDGTTYVWATDDTTDVVEEVSIPGSPEGNMSVVRITVTGADPDRTTLDITVTAPDPEGNEISGSLVVDIVPGVEHVFTLSVQQLLGVSVNPLGRKAKATQLPAQTPKHKK